MSPLLILQCVFCKTHDNSYINIFLLNQFKLRTSGKPGKLFKMRTTIKPRTAVKVFKRSQLEITDLQHTTENLFHN